MRTELQPKKAHFEISHHDTLLAIGSCFAENIGDRLAASHISTLINPFGIVYNPLSIAAQVQLLMAQNVLDDAIIEASDDLFFSFLHHSKFNDTDKNSFLTNLNTSLQAARKHLEQTNCLLLTLGTAQVFINKRTQQPVANCHKQPASLFTKKRVSIDETVAALQGVIEQLITKNPTLTIILSVSPVRYLREGIVESQRSKAILLLATEILAKNLPNTHYFPAYEYLLDDLRDYRYYADDLLHPNKQAIDYIWTKFSESLFSTETRAINQRILKLKQAQNHRPLHPETTAFRQFSAQLNDEIARFKADFPFVAF